jgi:biopolymer transport protein ExbB
MGFLQRLRCIYWPVIAAGALLVCAAYCAPPAWGAQNEGAARGDAAEGVIPFKDLLQIFRDGGPLMYAIAACSVVAMAFILERLVVLRRSRVIPRAFVKRFVAQLRDGALNRSRALLLCKDNGSPVAQVLGHAVAKWGRPSVEIEQAIVDGGERAVSHLRRNLRVLNGVATVSPLLGLLGTVVGMILTFNKIAANPQGMGKAEELAEGISMALLTTAAGLTVAIPALIAYLYFIGRVDRLVSEVDAQAQNVVQIISAESMQQALRKSAAAQPQAGGGQRGGTKAGFAAGS